MINQLTQFYEEGFVFLESASPGVGKTFVCQKVLSRRLAEIGVGLVSIDCRAIGFKMKDEEALQAGKSYIESKFKAAQESAPCVLLLDSIEDLLAQAEADPSQPFRLIRSQFFIAMVRSLVSTQAEVRLLATTRSAAKVGSALRDYGFFDRTISMKFPSQTQRKSLLQDLMEPFYEAAKEEGRVEEAVALSQNFMIQDMLRLQSKVLLSTDVSYDILKQEIQNLPLASLASMDLVKTQTTFSKIGGMQRAKQAVRDALLLPSRFGRLFGERRGSSGLLLYGPPGCGKTLLASAIGKECGLNLISVKGPELLSKYIGQSEQNVREAFEKAALAQPSVLFFDEFDSIVPRRGSGSTGVTDRLVNQFLTYLDGVEGRSGVYVVAASSRPDHIDVALLRPGRLDKQVYCGLPDFKERLEILKLYGESMGLKEGGGPQFLNEIAERTETYTGADLKGVLYNAQLQTVHRALKEAKSTKEEIKEAPPLTEQDVLIALKGYHPSLGAEERARLAAIYREFEGEKKIDVRAQLSTLF